MVMLLTLQLIANRLQPDCKLGSPFLDTISRRLSAQSHGKDLLDSRFERLNVFRTERTYAWVLRGSDTCDFSAPLVLELTEASQGTVSRKEPLFGVALGPYLAPLPVGRKIGTTGQSPNLHLLPSIFSEEVKARVNCRGRCLQTIESNPPTFVAVTIHEK